MSDYDKEVWLLLISSSKLYVYISLWSINGLQGSVNEVILKSQNI